MESGIQDDLWLSWTNRVKKFMNWREEFWSVEKYLVSVVCEEAFAHHLPLYASSGLLYRKTSWINGIKLQLYLKFIDKNIYSLCWSLKILRPKTLIYTLISNCNKYKPYFAQYPSLKTLHLIKKTYSESL